MRLVRTAAREPLESLERGRERLAARADLPAEGLYEPAPDWHRGLHELLRAPWPSDEERDFEQIWERVGQAMAQRGLRMGRGTFGGWDDADASFARCVFCLTTCLRPSVVVETGVA